MSETIEFRRCGAPRTHGTVKWPCGGILDEDGKCEACGAWHVQPAPPSSEAGPQAPEQQACPASDDTWAVVCELPAGHEGDHLALVDEWDEEGKVPPLRWTDALTIAQYADQRADASLHDAFATEMNAVVAKRIADLEATVTRLTAERQAGRERIAELTSDRDSWRRVAERLEVEKLEARADAAALRAEVEAGKAAKEVKDAGPCVCGHPESSHVKPSLGGLTGFIGCVECWRASLEAVVGTQCMSYHAARAARVSGDGAQPDA